MSLPALKLDPEIEEVESAALQLPREARARIAERLIASLDEETRIYDVLDEVDELLR